MLSEPARPLLLPLCLLLLSLPAARGAAPGPPPPDLAEYRTTETAITSAPKPESSPTEGAAGYLGLCLAPETAGRLSVTEVAPDSPGMQAGVQKGDVLLALSGQPARTVEEVRSRLQAGAPGETVVVRIERAGEVQELSATLGSLSRPVRIAVQRAVIGVRMGPGTEAAGIPVLAVTKDKPAAKAGLQNGDVLLKADGRDLGQEMLLADVLAERKPGDHVRLLVRRGAEEFERELELVEDENAAYVAPGENRALNTWKKEVFRLAVIGLEFTDRPHSDKIAAADWLNAFFSRDTYTAKSVTGEPVFGSVADYYAETSVNRLRMEGSFSSGCPRAKPAANSTSAPPRRPARSCSTARSRPCSPVTARRRCAISMASPSSTPARGTSRIAAASSGRTAPPSASTAKPGRTSSRRSSRRAAA